MSPSHWAQQNGVVAHIDGASRGNPGPAAYGVVLTTPQGEPLAAFSKFIGRTTNNVAEYRALIAALEHALKHGHLRLRVISDSELLTRQIEGRYKVKSADLKPLHERALALIGRFETFGIVHLPREQNREADRLANRALDGVEVGAGRKSASNPSPQPATEPLRASATFEKGVLKPAGHLALAEGEEVELEIRRKRAYPR